MATEIELVDRAVKMFRENRFLTLATTSEAEPWATPINYVIGPGPFLHFYSAANARHSLDVARNSSVSCAIFNSTASSDDVDGMQFSARCEVVFDPDLPRVSEYYFDVNFPDPETREWWYRPASAFDEGGVWHFYRLTIEDIYVIDFDSIEESRIDRRLPVDANRVWDALSVDVTGE